MAFQFLCPQGHLLQGEEWQAGQQCKCPYCQTEFLVPQPGGAPPAGAAPAPEESAAPAPEEPAGEGFPGIRVGPDLNGGARAGEVPQFGPVAAEQQSLLHIPCPQGHILETPREMLGQDAMCPFCQAQFRLRFEDSREYRQEREERRELREQKAGTAWMNWSIVAAVLVVLGVIVLIAIAAAD